MGKGRLLVLLCLLAAACGGQSGTVSASAPPPPSPSASPSPTASPRPTNSPIPPQSGPHFDTPETAMEYLAAAWNRKDLTSLKHVTDPHAGRLLVGMYRVATHLRLEYCTLTASRGDYECFLSHAFPAGYKGHGQIGTAEFTVGPAERPGWYMTYLIDDGG
jgi:hypothetical protein